MTPRSGWSAGQVVSVALLVLVLVIIALATLVGCGSSSEPAAPPGPYVWRYVPGATGLYEACTPAGDRVYGLYNNGVAVVPAGCATEPRS